MFQKKIFFTRPNYNSWFNYCISSNKSNHTSNNIDPKTITIRKTDRTIKQYIADFILIKMLIKLLKNVVFKKMVIIFLVGLASRYIVNSIFDMNVFKEWSDLISLLYYLGFSLFSSIVGSLSHISFDSLNYKAIKKAMEVFLQTYRSGHPSGGVPQLAFKFAGQPGGVSQPPVPVQPGIQSGGVAQPANPVQPVQIGGSPSRFYKQPLSNGYSSYIVTDIGGVAANGYINPQTGHPWHLNADGSIVQNFSYKGFPGNLAAAMSSHATDNGHVVRAWNDSAFDSNSAKFYREWQRYHYPNRNANMYNNSANIRRAFNRLP